MGIAVRDLRHSPPPSPSRDEAHDVLSALQEAEEPRRLMAFPSASSPDLSPDERRAAIRAELVLQRAALSRRLDQEGAGDLAAKLDACGQPTSLTCTTCGQMHKIETRCRRRWCPCCARAISAERVRKYERRLQGLQWPLWLTLTIRNRDDLSVVDDLKAGWKQFRRRKLFTERTKGGLWSLEVTERGNGWHPHIHAMLDCEWLAADTPPPCRGDDAKRIAEKISYAKAELASVWGECIGQEVGIALAVRKSGMTAVRELLKYAVKGSDLLATTLPIADLIRSIDAGRTISTFGSLRNGKLPPEPDDDRPGLACENCGDNGQWLPTYIVDMIVRSGR